MRWRQMALGWMRRAHPHRDALLALGVHYGQQVGSHLHLAVVEQVSDRDRSYLYPIVVIALAGV